MRMQLRLIRLLHGLQYMQVSGGCHSNYHHLPLHTEVWMLHTEGCWQRTATMHMCSKTPRSSLQELRQPLKAFGIPHALGDAHHKELDRAGDLGCFLCLPAIGHVVVKLQTM